MAMAAQSKTKSLNARRDDATTHSIASLAGEGFAEDGERGVVVPPKRRGRAAISNRGGRFESETRVDFDDGWGALDLIEPLRTQVTFEKARTIITRNNSPDIAFERSINPYRGCEHGCVYCFARPTHAFMGLSPGLDFESRLFVKQGAAELLQREISAPNYQVKTIVIGANTDPYQPIEREYKITRRSSRHWPRPITRSPSSPNRR